MLNQKTLSKREAAAIKRMAWENPSLRVGNYAAIRYELNNLERYGRIIGVEVLYPHNFHYTCQGEYAVFVVRMEDGTIRKEHAEHLCSAKAPKLQEACGFGKELFDLGVMLARG